MKTYLSHKTVKAAQITKVDTINGITLLDLDNHTVVPHPGTTKYEPKVDDYLVEYEDGYKSLSPKAAFEAGYTLKEEVK